MTKAELEKALKKTKSALVRCQRELKKRNTELKNAAVLAEKVYEETKKTGLLLKKLKAGKSKGGVASAEKRAAQGQELRAFWLISAEDIMQDLMDNDPEQCVRTGIDDLVDLIVQAVEDANFPFNATRSKDSIKRHLTANLSRYPLKRSG